MYVPSHFRQSELTEIKAFIRAHGFATVISVGSGRPIAAHLLVELREQEAGRLLLAGHMARANPLWTAFTPDTETLTIFLGADAYISPTWYSVPAVPTWNYTAVHAYGRPHLIDDSAELEGVLARLVDEHEAASARPFKLRELPRGMVEAMMKDIVGFEIEVTALEASSKLSQNRSPEDFTNIIRRLRERADQGSRDVADAMEHIRRSSLRQGSPPVRPEAGNSPEGPGGAGPTAQ